jgi:zinc transporter ZupT
VWSEKTALRILGWTVGLYVVAVFLIGYLSTDIGYITLATADLLFIVTSAIMVLAVVQMVIASKGMNRRTLLITLGLTVGYLLIRTLNKYFG